MTKNGFYVELENTVEGMVRLSSLRDDYYEYIEDTHMLVGEMTGRTFAPGQPVDIIVTDADEVMRTIEFRLYYHERNHHAEKH